MGRQAKLKKIRREASEQVASPPQSQTDSDPTKFVQDLEKQGYQLLQSDPSPSLPARRVEPQL